VRLLRLRVIPPDVAKYPRSGSLCCQEDPEIPQETMARGRLDGWPWSCLSCARASDVSSNCLRGRLDARGSTIRESAVQVLVFARRCPGECMPASPAAVIHDRERRGRLLGCGAERFQLHSRRRLTSGDRVCASRPRSSLPARLTLERVAHCHEPRGCVESREGSARNDPPTVILSAASPILAIERPPPRAEYQSAGAVAR